jgi:hypothetical protein
MRLATGNSASGCDELILMIVKPLYDGGRMRKTERAGIRTLERACLTADAQCGAPFDPN